MGYPSVTHQNLSSKMGWVGLNKMAYPPRPNPTHENPCPFTQSGISDLILKKTKNKHKYNKKQDTLKTTVTVHAH
jgi:hypothetical protein